jgi:hypothetical protein
MSTCYIACKYCGGEIGSAQAMTILKETDQGITEACHPECAEPVKMKCLSVRQPWANAIFVSGKDVENRSRHTDYRGPLLIHASKTIDREASSSPWAGRARALGCTSNQGRFVTGAIIGIVDLTDVVDESPSFWAQPDCWHWLLANRRLLAEPIACAGKPGIFEVEIPLGAMKKAQTPNPKGENL